MGVTGYRACIVHPTDNVKSIKGEQGSNYQCLEVLYIPLSLIERHKIATADGNFNQMLWKYLNGQKSVSMAFTITML